MGQPMAARLLAAGFPVTVWNRTRDKAEPLLTSGARWAESPAAAVSGAAIVITMLTNAPAVNAVLFDSNAVDAIQPGTIVVDMSTTSPPVAKDHAARLAARNIRYIDAPVSGGTAAPPPARWRSWPAAMPTSSRKVAPIFAAMGTARRVGPVGSGQLCKLANQLIVAVTIGAVAEALVLAEKGGPDPVAVRRRLAAGLPTVES